MTEQEWLSAQDPEALLRCLDRATSQRKLRLFAVACCRQVWHLLDDQRSVRAVEVAELYADGHVTDAQLLAAWDAAWAAASEAAQAGASDATRAAFVAAAWATARAVAVHTVRAVAVQIALGDAPAASWDNARADILTFQVALLRDIFGNPFRPVDVAPGWRTPAVLSIARRAYDGRDVDGAIDPVTLAVLADALLDAGCEDETILAHLRGPTHVRGCWALDGILALRRCS